MNIKVILAAFLCAAYVGGCVHLNNEVRRACTHGNCKHGWNSKYTGSEKLAFIAWAIGVPGAVYLGWRAAGHLSSTKVPMPDPQNRTSEIGRVPPPPPSRPPRPRPERVRKIPVGGKIVCPKCKGPTVLRTALRGARQGQKFYGCKRFPRCRGVVNVASSQEVKGQDDG
ncbi:topoisomerase DNA-binding C4 zinc finger domain-containing protein [Piscinibacter sp. Jin2]|uniref:Topoisomerase DNA-binding C4 zinc finger domain-containing protein n=1 Tax=Aquariibacter lacus TaxID=2801332 RepID=A0A9X0XJB9_9BURK|nr:topoisomerase DNA-binding C4 zinc finger domain-containing protein [Piscinibacter lacus]